MATIKKTTTKDKDIDLNQELKQLRLKLSEIKLNIKAGLEKNTNAVSPVKKQIAQLLTKLNTPKI